MDMNGLLKLVLAAAVLACAPGAQAQDYPSKPIRMIVPLPPGSGVDIIGRLIAQRINTAWGQPVIVDNRPGAGGLIGTSAVVKADPDGYTLLVQSGSHASNSSMYKQLPYDPLKDLAEVALLGKTPYVMVTAANGPYRTLRALLDAAKAKPGDIAFASSGVGNSTHLVAEYAARLAGVSLLHVPFKGSPEAMTDVLGNRSAFYMAPINAAVNLVKEGKLAALGVSTRNRADVLPAVPTLAEQGLTGYDMTLWFGLWAPAATPPAVVQKLNAQVNAIVQMPEVREQFSKLGLQPSPMKPEEFAAFVREEMKVYAKIVKDANIQPQ
jgi:tripartite-type tricarboxylate transporter receptor subunit TctC